MLIPLQGQIVGTLERKAVISDLIAAGGIWLDMEMRLYQSPTNVPPDTVILADLTEADFDGYAAVAPVVMHGPALANDNSAYIVSDTSFFTATGTTTPNVIYGAYLVNTAGNLLIAVFPFTVPVGVNNIGDSVPVVVQLHYSGV